MRVRIALATLTCAVVAVRGLTQAPADWPQWRGPSRDGISPAKALLKAWPPAGPPLAWRTGGAGEGYSSFAVTGGRLYTMGADARNEFVVAIDAASGKQVWKTTHGRRFGNDRGDGPRGTPTVDGGRVYALGANGDLSCLEAQSGKMVWSVNLLRQFGGSNIPWGLSESPLVLEDRVLAQASGTGAAIVALDKNTGSLLWKTQSDEAGYSSAVVQQIGSIRQAIFFTSQRTVGVDVRDGRLLWSYDRVANSTANIATPIVHQNRAFVSSDYGAGCALLEFMPGAGGVQMREIYFNRDMRNHHSSAVLVRDHLYGFSSSILIAMRFDTGAVIWRDRSVGKGSVVYADERLYLYSEDGVVGLAEASPAGYREHGRFRIPPGALPTWAHPVVADGRLYVRDQDMLYAFDVRLR